MTWELILDGYSESSYSATPRFAAARLPWVKTLEQFDFTFQPGIDRKIVRELAGLAFVERSENVILLGPPGVGKTHLAIALGVKAVDAGHRVLFMPLDRLIATLMKAKQENRLERQLQQLRACLGFCVNAFSQK